MDNQTDNATTITTKKITNNNDSSNPSKSMKSTAGGLHVDTTTMNLGVTASSSFDERKSPASTSAQDMHPYARGAVIEVWHIPKKTKGDNNYDNNNGGKNNNNKDDDDDWWSEEDSSDEEQSQQRQRTVRLCDIIDRVPHGTNSWRYYVHYRDFNRRMDEWIHVSRIVSPPSVGNAKARALKREEERAKKRKLKEEIEQKEAAAAALASVIGSTGPRSRRRSSAIPFSQQQLQQQDGSMDEADTNPNQRRKRVLRRKSSILDDDVTISTSNVDDTDLVEDTVDLQNVGMDGPAHHTTGAAAANTKEIVAIDAGVHTTTVGEHVVATVQAVELDEHEGLDEASLREHEEVTKIKNVGFLELGKHQMETWYFSPLPKELIQGNNAGNTANTNSPGFLEVLFVCEFTFRMFARKSELRRFQRTIRPCDRHPPGNEIYRHENLAMFEVDGLEEKIYCQNLCYIAKLFLDHKTLYFDVDPFLFYILCEVDNRGFHPVGYFSKEKYSDVGYNLACILSFPAHQRKGYGRFLIAFSYELTKKEEKVGSPEKPMSDLGQQAYKPYWASTIIDFLLHQSHESSLSIMDISKRTSIMAEDIIYTLNQLGILKILNGVYFIAAEKTLLSKLAQKYPVKEPRVDPSKLHWTPFLTDVKRDKFSIHSKKPSVESDGTTTRPGSTVSFRETS